MILDKKFIKKIQDYWLLFILLAIFLFFLGTYMIFNLCKEDYLQGKIYKIIYLHVPAAWISILIYSLMSFFSACYIIFNNQYCSIYAYAFSHIGCLFCFICLITGSIWGKETWGAWWVWDSRLTSMLILFFLYIIYISLWDLSSYYSKLSSILNILGFINIPIIKFSVNLWSTLHQPSTFIRKGGISLDKEMLLPFFIILSANIVLVIILFIIRFIRIINKKKINRYIINETYNRY